MDNPSSEQCVARVSQLVSAYISNNSVPVSDLPGLIGSVHAVLSTIGTSGAEAEPAFEKPAPGQVRKSVTPDALISFIDGKSYKTLKRHLTKHGLDPRSYKERYGLPSDYPMIAASHSAARSELARNRGLGRKATTIESESMEAVREAPKPRGRPRKSPAA